MRIVQAASEDYTRQYQSAKQADYVGFLHRHPFSTDAYRLGFAVGFREDTSGFQIEDVPNVDLPVSILDNDFRDPDLDRYLERVEQYRPDIAILGDAYTRADAAALQQAVDELTAKYDDVEPVIVPKCRDALDAIDRATVVGYSMGYADTTADTFSDPADWRSRRVHLLGGSPHDQDDVIQALTQPTLTGDPPADIVGFDGNGVQKAAYFGEYWTPHGYQVADHLSIRETVRWSLERIKQIWQEREVWPAETPRDRYGPETVDPPDNVYAVDGGDISSQEELEQAIVETYDTGITLAYRTGVEKSFVEYRDGLMQ